jgi:hypothetical protein
VRGKQHKRHERDRDERDRGHSHDKTEPKTKNDRIRECVEGIGCTVERPSSTMMRVKSRAGRTDAVILRFKGVVAPNGSVAAVILELTGLRSRFSVFLGWFRSARGSTNAWCSSARLLVSPHV